MTFQISGTSGLTFPDTTTQGTGGVSRSGDTMSGGLTLGGQLNLGSNGQIVFPATQSASSNANTLDDYEEGTWTPEFTTVDGTFSAYSTQQGFYTKVGRVVTVFWYLQGVTLSGTSTNSVNVAGMPFAGIAAAEPAGSVWINNSFVAIPLGQGAAAQFGFYKTNTTGVTTVTGGEVAGRYCIGSLTYFSA